MRADPAATVSVVPSGLVAAAVAAALGAIGACGDRAPPALWPEPPPPTLARPIGVEASEPPSGTHAVGSHTGGSGGPAGPGAGAGEPTPHDNAATGSTGVPETDAETDVGTRSEPEAGGSTGARVADGRGARGRETTSELARRSRR